MPTSPCASARTCSRGRRCSSRRASSASRSPRRSWPPGWRAGAGDVQVLYQDDYERYLLAKHGDEERLTRSNAARVGFVEFELDARAASINVTGDSTPPYFADVDDERLARTKPTRIRELLNRTMNEQLAAWVVIAHPDESWAERMFGTPDVERLFEEIAHACRLHDADPVASWKRAPRRARAAADAARRAPLRPDPLPRPADRPDRRADGAVALARRLLADGLGAGLLRERADRGGVHDAAPAEDRGHRPAGPVPSRTRRASSSTGSSCGSTPAASSRRGRRRARTSSAATSIPTRARATSASSR